MKRTTMNAEAVHPADEATSYLFDNWFDPIEAGLRERVRGFIETMLETELEAVLARPRYGRQPAARGDESAGIGGHRHGRRTRRRYRVDLLAHMIKRKVRLGLGEEGAWLNWRYT